MLTPILSTSTLWPSGYTVTSEGSLSSFSVEDMTWQAEAGCKRPSGLGPRRLSRFIK